MVNNDYNSASNIAFLLDVSEVLEDYAKKISVNNLKDSLMLQMIQHNWSKTIKSLVYM